MPARLGGAVDMDPEQAVAGLPLLNLFATEFAATAQPIQQIAGNEFFELRFMGHGSPAIPTGSAVRSSRTARCSIMQARARCCRRFSSQAAVGEVGLRQI